MTDITEWEPSGSILVEPAKVYFQGYGAYTQMAQNIADYINSIEVTEDNIQAVKKDLAAARKVVDGLGKRRIELKKQILVEYDVFEQEVKELQSIVDTADRELRAKVNALEEQERELKKAAIREIWDKRIWQYPLVEAIENPFEAWLPKHLLNKSVSMKSAEAEMVGWLEKVNKDLQTLKGMDDEYLVEYLYSLDVTEAIASVNARNQKAAMASVIKQVEDEEAPATAHYIVTGDKDIALAESLFNQYKINYIKK